MVDIVALANGASSGATALTQLYEDTDGGTAL